MYTEKNNKGYNVGRFSGQSFRSFDVCCCVVAIYDLVHDVEATFHLP